MDTFTATMIGCDSPKVVSINPALQQENGRHLDPLPAQQQIFHFGREAVNVNKLRVALKETEMETLTERDRDRDREAKT